MSTKITFTPDQVRLIETLIADGCPPGEIGDTVGVNAHAITAHFPAAKMTKQQIAEWLSLRAFITKCEKTYDRRTDAPRLGRMVTNQPKKPAKPEPAPRKRGPAPNEYPQEKLAEARRLLTAGASYAQASRAVGLSAYVLKSRLPGLGAPSKRYPKRVPA